MEEVRLERVDLKAAADGIYLLTSSSGARAPAAPIAPGDLSAPRGKIVA
jgi:hypothetical protein